jgi:hypothetical protein
MAGVLSSKAINPMAAMGVSRNLYDPAASISASAARAVGLPAWASGNPSNLAYSAIDNQYDKAKGYEARYAATQKQYADLYAPSGSASKTLLGG